MNAGRITYSRRHFAALLLIWCTAAAWAQPVEQQYSGTLIEEDSGQPVANASVYFPESRQHAFSDARGKFGFRAESGKTLLIEVRHLGYEPYRTQLSLEAGVAITLSLRPSIRMLDEILIEHRDLPMVSQRAIDREAILRKSPRDVGDIFSGIGGFGLIKRGGYAMDPVFRSFKYEQINLIYDGGLHLTNACPNRMDPASTQVTPAEIQKIEVIKGPFSVRYGQTMGPIINIITNRVGYSDRPEIHGEVAGGYEFNGPGISTRAALSATGRRYELGIQGGLMDFDNYQDGNGREIPSAFKTYNYAVKLGLMPATGQRFQATWRQTFGRDILHAGLPMDLKEDQSNQLVLDYQVQNIRPRLAAINAKVYYSTVDHLMTNENRPNFAVVEAYSPVTSMTWGGRLELALQPGSVSTLHTGFDLRNIGKDGQRNRLVKSMNGMPLDPPRAFTDLIWQDSWQNNLGVFGEYSTDLSERWTVLAGLRLDYVYGGADDPAPDFEALYGSVQPDDDWNTSATATLRYAGLKDGMLQLSMGRGQRSADLLERYINHFNVGRDNFEYVGDPNLVPEANHQVDLTAALNPGPFSLSGNVFFSYITDYITARIDSTLPRKFMPGQPPLYAKRFINIDEAIQWGFDLDAAWQLRDWLSLHGGLYYTWAQNLDFDEPLAEITPLTGTLALRMERKTYWTELKGRLVASQERISATFGEQATPGFQVFDLLAGYQPRPFLQVELALKNIFDVAYYEHLNRTLQNLSDTGMFYEPGRQLRLGIKFSF
jgi:iron complex outermembrane recepter protein